MPKIILAQTDVTTSMMERIQLDIKKKENRFIVSITNYTAYIFNFKC